MCGPWIAFVMHCLKQNALACSGVIVYIYLNLCTQHQCVLNDSFQKVGPFQTSIGLKHN